MVDATTIPSRPDRSGLFPALGAADWRSPALVAAEAKVMSLIEDIRKINIHNDDLLKQYADRLDENVARFEARMTELRTKMEEAVRVSRAKWTAAA